MYHLFSGFKGFVKCVNHLDGGSLDPRLFEASFLCYLRVITGLHSLQNLHVEGIDKGPFTGCGVCADVPHAGMPKHGQCPDVAKVSSFYKTSYSTCILCYFDMFCT